jgi:hypothetical protein
MRVMPARYDEIVPGQKNVSEGLFFYCLLGMLINLTKVVISLNYQIYKSTDEHWS